MKYLVKLQTNSQIWQVMTKKLIAFNLIHLEQKIRKEIKELQAKQNKYYYLTGGYSFEEYTKKDYLIDIIEDALKNPEEINSRYMADEIFELFFGEEE